MLDRTYATETEADDGSPTYQHWWQEALVEVQRASISTWAEKVAAARCLYELGPVSPAQRIAWQKQAITMALYRNERAAVGGWTPAECVAKARMSYEQMLADPNRPRDLASLRHGLAELGNPNIPCHSRDRWVELGERMLARVR